MASVMVANDRAGQKSAVQGQTAREWRGYTERAMWRRGSGLARPAGESAVSLRLASAMP